MCVRRKLKQVRLEEHSIGRVNIDKDESQDKKRRAH